MSEEQKYYDVLKKIARGYQSAPEVLRNAENEYGLSPCEALEMAYDNIQVEAENAIRGKRRPKDKQP